jgi:hypothetical protein
MSTLHAIERRLSDPASLFPPGPVWGLQERKPLSFKEEEITNRRVMELLDDLIQKVKMRASESINASEPVD